MSGDFSDSEEFGFHLYPVFADGEGEAAYAIGSNILIKMFGRMPHAHCIDIVGAMCVFYLLQPPEETLQHI